MLILRGQLGSVLNLIKLKVFFKTLATQLCAQGFFMSDCFWAIKD